MKKSYQDYLTHERLISTKEIYKIFKRKFDNANERLVEQYKAGRAERNNSTTK